MLDKPTLEQFSRQGYCLVKGALAAADFDEVRADYRKTLDNLCAAMTTRGELADDHAGLPFTERYVRITRDTGKVLAQHFTIALPQQGVRADTPIFLAPSVFNLLTHPRILDLVEDFIGPEIAVSPVGNVRIKPPENMVPEAEAQHARRGLFRATPWHQDNGVITEDADETPMITVWFPISDASVEAGCLQLLPGSHRERLICHCPDENGELSIPDKLLPEEKPTPVPMRAGDILFLHRRLCHASLPNRGNDARWSFDLRYIPAGGNSGRDLFPSFVARSRKNPESVLRDPEQWAQMWRNTRDKMADTAPTRRDFNRWSADADVCA